MKARRLALAWCWGSVCGLVVGWVYGSAVRDLAAFRALRRAEPGPGAPQPLSGHSGTVEPLNGVAQEAAPWCRDVDLWSFNVCTREPGHPGAHMDDTGGLTAWGTHEPPIPFQRDDEPCPQYSPGGGLPCSVTGTHTAHIFLGSCAPDAKDDADERIE